MTEQGPGRQERGNPEPASPEFPADISELIVAASADGVIAVDDQGIIRLCNPAAAEMFARPSRDLLGTQFGFPLVSSRAAEVELRLPGGRERVVEMRVIVTTVQREPLHIASLRDITRRRWAERRLEAALERQNIVVGVAAHELHNPLAAISMLAHVLQDQQASMTPSERAALINRIAERTARLQALVRKLLTASRIDAAAVPAVIEAVPLLEVIAEQLAGMDEGSREAEVACSPDLVVAADRAELSMMLGNYLENAFTHGSPPVEIRAARRERSAEIRVIDHGPGVAPDFAPSLFQRFARGPGAELKAEGTGLGLWIVRSFARANGGDAWYEPGEKEGSCFCLRLPLPPAGPGEEAGAGGA